MIWGPAPERALEAKPPPQPPSSQISAADHQAARWRSWTQPRASYLISQSATVSRKWDTQQWYCHQHSSVKSRRLNYHAVTQRLAAGVDLLHCGHYLSIEAGKPGGNQSRLLLYLVENFSLAGNLHISYKCVFVSEAAPLFYCTNLLPQCGAGKKMEEGAIEREAMWNREKQRQKEGAGARRAWRNAADREGCWMCVLPPKGSLSIDTVLEDRTQRVFNGQKSFTHIYKHTHAIPPSNIPVSTRPPRITALTEVESTLEDERMRGGKKIIKLRDQEEAAGGGVSTWPVSRGIK